MKYFFQKNLLIFVFVALLSSPYTVSAQTNNCPDITNQFSGLVANCNAFYNSCVSAGSTNCANTAEAYVVGLNKYQTCTGQTSNPGWDCTNYNRQQEQSTLRNEYASLVPGDQTINIGTPPDTPPQSGDNPSSGGGSSTVQPPITIGSGGSSQTSGCVDNSASGQQVPANSDGTCPMGSTPVSNGQQTTQTDTNITYTPLEPLPGIGNIQNGKASFGVLMSGLFKILIVLGGLIAVGAFVYAGISYMISEAIDRKSEAKKRLWAALYGLLLLLASWVVLFTINPQLVEFNGGLNPIQNSFYTAPQQQQTTQLQKDQAACTQGGGQLQVYSGSDGISTLNCNQLRAQSRINSSYTCGDETSGSVCVTPVTASNLMWLWGNNQTPN